MIAIFNAKGRLLDKINLSLHNAFNNGGIPFPVTRALDCPKQ